MTDKEAALQLCESLGFDKVDHWPKRFQYQEKEHAVYIGPHASAMGVVEFVFNKRGNILFHTVSEP